MTSERLCIVLNYDWMNMDRKVAVKEFLLNFFLEHEVKHFKLDESITGNKKEIIVIPSRMDAVKFQQYVEDRKLIDHVAISCLHDSGWVAAPEGRSYTAYNDFDGLHTYVRPGDTLSGVGYRAVKGVVHHGAWNRPEPASRYMGKVARLWAVGASSCVDNVIRQFQYDLRRDRKKPATPLCLEDYMAPAIARLDEHAKLCMFTTRGDLYTVTDRNIDVFAMAEPDVVLKAAVHGWRKFKHEFYAKDLETRFHDLSPREQQFRHAAHSAAIDRNGRGYI